MCQKELPPAFLAVAVGSTLLVCRCRRGEEEGREEEEEKEEEEFAGCCLLACENGKRASVAQ